jgi:hypothetical protein
MQTILAGTTTIAHRDPRIETKGLPRQTAIVTSKMTAPLRSLIGLDIGAALMAALNDVQCWKHGA